MNPIAPTQLRPAAVDKHCVFRGGRSWYSLAATAIREVTVTPELVRVPGSHAVLAGLCHARNEFLPAVLLQPLLGHHAAEPVDAGRMLVLSGTGGSWAMLVEEIIALESLETITDPDARFSDLHSAVMGTATFRNQVVRVLDPNALYRRAEELLRNSWTALVQPLHEAPITEGDA